MKYRPAGTSGTEKDESAPTAIGWMAYPDADESGTRIAVTRALLVSHDGQPATAVSVPSSLTWIVRSVLDTVRIAATQEPAWQTFPEPHGVLSPAREVAQVVSVPSALHAVR